MHEGDYRQVEARLDEALTIFAEKHAQFSASVLRVRDNIASVRDSLETLRTDRKRIAAELGKVWRS